MFCRRRIVSACFAFAAVALMGLNAHAATVTVTPGTTYQTMDGIGAFHAMPTLFRPAGQFWMDRPQDYDYDRMVTDLGASMIRFDISATACFPVEGGGYNWMAANSVINAMRAYRARGVDRFIVTAWSPPGWMKYTKSAILGGVLDPAYADAYGTFLADYCKMIKDSVGVDPYALSVQNEPQFPEPYESAIMNDAPMSHQLDITQPKLTAYGLTTRFFGAEHMMWAGVGSYTTTVQNPNLYAFAVHGYTDGVAPDYGNDAAWAAIRTGVPAAKKVWMTESSPLPTTALATVQSMHMSIVSGQLSGWTWWAYADNCGTYTQTGGTNTSWAPNAGYYGTKHYARFVRPGAVRVGAASNVTTLWATAFKNTNDAYAVVLINGGTGTETVSITGSGLPATWNQYTTSGANNCALTGTTNGTSISMAAGAIVTLLSGTAVPVLAADTTQNSLTAPIPDNTVGKFWGFGDDVLKAWINQSQIGDANNDSSKVNQNLANGMARIYAGNNIVACYVQNQAWGGGLLASMILPGGDTLRTDGTWKVTYKNPTADATWTTYGYDDSKWRPAKDVGPADIWPGFARWGSSAVNMYYQKAHWILGGEKVYFRKTVTFTTAYNGIYIRGRNFAYKMYVDGNMVKQGTEFTVANCAAACFTTPAATAAQTFASGSTHTIAFEITDASSDGNGVLMKAGFSRSGSPLPMDTTWWCAPDTGATGWNTNAGATDNSDWSHPDIISAYDSGSGVGSWIYPGQFWFRKQFTSSQGLNAYDRKLGGLLKGKAVAGVKYYNLQGRLVNAAAGKAASSNLLLKRVVYKNGAVEDIRQVKTR